MLFPVIPEDFSALSAEELEAFIADSREAIQAVAAEPAKFVNAELTSADLVVAAREQKAAIETAKEALAALDAEPVEVEISDEDAAELMTLAADDAETEAEVEAVVEPETEDETEEAAAGAELEPVVASAAKPKPARRALPRPTRDRQPVVEEATSVSLTASASATGFEPGDEMDLVAVAQAMERRRKNFGILAPGESGEQITIARADWSHLYPDERRLSMDEVQNQALVAAAIDPEVIKLELRARRDGKSLTASGGLCAPVTPYYQLAMISQADRPVRAGLAAFNADRGGIRYARPAALSIIGTAVGTKTVAQDAAGGTQSVKTCQVVECPPWEEVDVRTIFHCLQFGNLGARTFPERVAQWNSLTLAAHARLAESWLLTGIDTASTQVTAGTLGLGSTASLLGQVLAAANGLRNRHRMDPDAVLRLMMPDWAIDMLISDGIRSQFYRYDTDEAKITALLRSFDIEPSFYIDTAFNKGQIFGAQGAHELLEFPSTVVWYLFPEGSFLYIDGGTLELGLVRDSVLNSTNDFQIFGESFENVAFVGVESLAVSSSVCDSGVTAGTHNPGCPISYVDVS